MKTGNQTQDYAVEALAIAASALKHSHLSDLTKVLQAVGEVTNSFAVVLWERAPTFKPENPDLPGQLFALAGWLMNGERFASHTLPLRSRTGDAVVRKETQVCADVETDPVVYRDLPDFFSKYGVRSFLSIPLELANGEIGALNLYRTSSSPHSQDERGVAEAFTKILPGIYESLREKSSLRLIGSVNGVIQKYEAHRDRLSDRIAQEGLQEMARTIAGGFQCLETSVYLIQADVDNKARLQATTFPPYVRRREYSVGESGLTGWILKHRQPIRIFDLRFFERDRPMIETWYPRLTGYKQERLLEMTKERLGISQNDALPPLCFMGVPIRLGNELLGVIRCCTPLQAPYYYNDADIKLLSLVASQVGHYWKNWTQLSAIQNENRSWKSLVDSLGDVISSVSAAKERPDELTLLNQFLSVARQVIQAAEIMDIRLHDPVRKDLYIAATQGDAWNEGKPEVKKQRREARFPLDGKSAGAWVFNHNRMRPIPNVKNDPLYRRTFPDVKSMIIAPVSSGSEKYGVLDIRITKDTGIPPKAPTITELLGRQLGLSLHLSRTLEKVGAVERELKENVTRLEQSEAEREKYLEIQTRVFEDLEHQLKLPVLQAHSRLSKLLAKELPADKILSNVKAVRGLLRKSERVVRGMGIFVALAKGQILQPRPQRLYKGFLVKLLIEICMDCTFLEGITSRGLTFNVNDESFDVLDSISIKCDLDLLEQAAYDIIDNACKYSFSFQRIVVSGGVNAQGRFYVSIVNRGLELRAEDIPHATERGWRGQGALRATGQGSGIGCWFAHQMLLAHGGELKLFPTTPERLTEVRLQF